MVLSSALFLGGCAELRTREDTAIIRPTVFEIPVVYGNSVFIEAVDGYPIDKSLGYVELDAGEHILKVGYVSCVLPILIFTCLADLGVHDLKVTVEAGKDYKVGRGGGVWLQEVGSGKVIARSNE